MKQENFLIKGWYVIYPALIYLVISIVSSILFLLAYAVYESSIMMNSGNYDSFALSEKLMDATYQYGLMITGIGAAITIPILAFLYWKDRKEWGIGKENDVTAMDYILVIPLALFSCFAFNNIISISQLSDWFPGYNEVSNQIYGGNIIVEVIVTVIMAPIVEELIFRGFAYRRIARYWNKKAALIGSALLFGIYHFNVVQCVYAFCVGLIFAFIYEIFQNIKATILAHGVANLLSVLLAETTWFNGVYHSDLFLVASTGLTLVCMIGLVFVLGKKSEQKEESTYH